MTAPPPAAAGHGPWIAYHRPRPAPRVRLFCFPYAGGGASIYRGWSAALHPDIEVWPVQLPGREGRIREPAFSRADELVAALLGGLAEPLARGPFAFFGHSMGALIAFELARALRLAGTAGPLHLFVSARRSPDLPARDDDIHDLPEPEFRARLRELNGTPEAVLEHPELMDLLGPLLRADFTLSETHDFVPGPPLACPITAFGGRDDADVTADDLSAWRRQTTAAYRLTMLAGDHFFLHHEGGEALRREIERDLL